MRDGFNDKISAALEKGRQPFIFFNWRASHGIQHHGGDGELHMFRVAAARNFDRERR